MQRFLRRLILTGMVLIPLLAAAQDNKPNKAQKKSDKKKEQHVENKKKGELKGRKRHMSLQTKEVRKRMKKHSRYINNKHKNRKSGFFKRLFHGNEH